MAAKKFAISVPEEVMDEVDQAAQRSGLSRSAYIVMMLRRIARARSDSEVSRRINAVFADPDVRHQQAETARAYRRRTPGSGTEW